MFEITKGILGKYDVIRVVLRPPVNQKDVLDIQLSLISKDLPGTITGYMSVDEHRGYNPRSYTSRSVSMSESAKKDLRAAMNQLAAQLDGELSNV